MNTTPYNKYERTGVSHMTPWTPELDMTGVSISDADLANGSPKQGDMVARNPNDITDRWLVAEEYFLANFRLVG